IIAPLIVVLPLPAMVSRLLPVVILPLTVNKLLELLVHDCGLPRLSGAVIVSAPAVAPCVMPLAPSVSELALPPPAALSISTVPALLNTRPSADWGASRFTVCGVLTVVTLKMAMSPAPGFAKGSNIRELELEDVDHGPLPFQVVPVPSQ